MRHGGPHLPYGGPWFAAASALPLAENLNRPQSLARLVGVALAHPWRLVALIGLLSRAPRLDVQLSDSATGDMLREHFGQHLVGGFPLARLCRGVLILPEHHRDYLRGRHRHALRNNLRRAAAAGIGCESLDSASTAVQAVWHVMRHRRAGVTAADRAGLEEVWPAVLAHPDVTTLAARDATGNILAVACVVIDTQVCVAVLAVACSHEARWALHDHLVQTLIAGRVRYVLAADGGPFGALGLPPDVQYFQRLLGYELCHISPREARARPSAGGERPRRRGLYEQLAMWESHSRGGRTAPNLT